MASVIEHFAADHRACDDVFARAEQAIAQRAQTQAADAFARFHLLLDAHFRAEEDVIFPAFEAATGMSAGPSAVMRSEHGEMLGLCEDVRRLIMAGDFDEAGSLADTLFSIMQAHNMKEEQILYPMCDQVLSAHPQVVADAIARLGTPEIPQ
ncbi:hemerythrin domain-containing protein [Niveibacterium sp.]|uniref:hemerythrin domain-containing protein n=1 Tax=Niveibacterium sp. TaxID=2017444 RepID=UPI0035B1C4B8